MDVLIVMIGITMLDPICWALALGGLLALRRLHPVAAIVLAGFAASLGSLAVVLLMGANIDGETAICGVLAGLIEAAILKGFVSALRRAAP